MIIPRFRSLANQLKIAFKNKYSRRKSFGYIFIYSKRMTELILAEEVTRRTSAENI